MVKVALNGIAILDELVVTFVYFQEDRRVRDRLRQVEAIAIPSPPSTIDMATI